MMVLKEKLSLGKLEWRPSVGGTGTSREGFNLRNKHPGCTGDTGACFGPSGYTKKSSSLKGMEKASNN